MYRHMWLFQKLWHAVHVFTDQVCHSDVVMENLIGDDMDRVPQIAREPSAALHLYGKAEVKAGRKMGHVNRISA